MMATLFFKMSKEILQTCIHSHKILFKSDEDICINEGDISVWWKNVTYAYMPTHRHAGMEGVL